MAPALTQPEALVKILGERNYQDQKFPQDPPLPPSDELRVIKLLIKEADSKWYTTRDSLVNGVKVNFADQEALRKIAATALRAIQTWGCETRTIPPDLKPITALR